ncbi:hypothetical protein LPB19_16625 [Marinobacter salinisoli]|uniref:Uncharacterized protein n=1 Tax=Marinobacter salinisoli TaxID=2769486 RepID=A0ABX7MR48_9GAMM|nr:hypothetical protein [Marinobacter salinisoli]QSP94771.1 hypothetical protein LPB19_16625 [Marinobacter salinisoli]
MKQKFINTCGFAALTALPILLPGIQVVYGTGSWAVSGIGYFLVLILVLTFVGVIRVTSRLAPIQQDPTIRRTTNTQVLFGCVAGFVLGIYASEKLRILGFELAVERAKPVTEAMKAYVKKLGHVPTSLDSLIPEYLPKMPAKLPPLEIVREPYRLAEFGAEQWALEADAASGLTQWDYLIYHPGETYPKIENGLKVKIIGNWGYFYD